MVKRFGESGKRLDVPPGGPSGRRVALRRRLVAVRTCRAVPAVGGAVGGPPGCRLARLLLGLLAVAGALVSPSPPASAQEFTLDDAAALIRFVHAAPAAPSLDFHVDGALLVQGLAYGSATDIFISLPAGPHTLGATSAGAAVAEGSLDLAAGTAYDVAAIGLFPVVSLEVYPVDTSPTSDGRARLRLIACAPDAAAAGLAGLGSQGVIDGIPFSGVSDYVEIEPGVYDLMLRLDGYGEAATIDLGGVVFDAGATYDLFVLGLIADGSATVLLVRAQPFDGET